MIFNFTKALRDKIKTTYGNTVLTKDLTELPVLNTLRRGKIKVSFLGGARSVTGSKYLLEVNNKRILIDCGLFQGPKYLTQRNWHLLPFKARYLDAIILTHAHIDHSGCIPIVARDGFKGSVYCTEVTRDLCSLLLPDSGFLHEKSCQRAHRRRKNKKEEQEKPLYTALDGTNAMDRFQPVEIGKRFVIGDDISFTLYRNGHIMGSTFVVFECGETSILFSGDLGRTKDFILNPSVRPPGVDYIFIESTYGDRLHDTSDPKQHLEEAINSTIQNGGTLLIPAFAVGRSQILIHLIASLKREGRISKNIPVYLDSPMSIKATDIFCRNSAETYLSADDVADIKNAAIMTKSVDE